MKKNRGAWRCVCTSQGIVTFVVAYGTGLFIMLVMSLVKSRLHHPEWRQVDHTARATTAPVNGTTPPETTALSGDTPGRGKYKLIVYWNKFFKEEDFRFGFGHEPFEQHGCPVNTCYTTADKNLAGQADAVLMHGPVVKPLPPKPRGNQRYVYAQGEPHKYLSAELLPELEDYINLTMTYRTDSDIRLPYGVVLRDQKVKRGAMNVNPMSKSRAVVWAVSHCDTDSQREVYVKELMKYIDVDIYGVCGKKECERKSVDCMGQFEQRYRFVLSFENDFCKDYASEKLYRPLSYDIVPIVYGGANYTRDAPPDSVIDIRHYPNPRNLAKYLKYLTRNRDEYNEYFAWKRQGYRVERDRRAIMGKAMCRLCEILHDPDYKYMDYRDIKDWWLSKSCQRQIMDRIKRHWS